MTYGAGKSWPPVAYDRRGKPLDLDAWSKLVADRDYKRVVETDVAGYWVSTVWLGLDHGFGRYDAPLIFETMVFARNDDESVDFGEVDCWRYATEQAARKGHEEAVERVRAAVAGVVTEAERTVADRAG